MNIVLINPYAKNRTFCPPLGILYLAGMLRKSGYDVSIFDLDVDRVTDDEFLNHVRERQPLFVGMTCNIVQIPEVFRLAELIASLGVTIVVGGPMLTSAPAKIMACDAIDFGVVGEGEQTLVELARAIEEGSDFANINGIVYRQNGALHQTNAPEFISDLDSIPFPAHDLNGGVAKYASNPTPAPETPLAAVLPSRGCPFNCNFCSNPWKTTNRKRSVPNVIDELSWLLGDFGVQQVFFYDDSFNSDPEYVKELCQAIIDNKLKFGWRADCRANENLLDIGMLKLMKASGCWLLAFGVETGNARIMKNLRKGLKLKDVIRARELCSNAGILFRSFFMLGCPGETYATAFDTIDFARQLNPDDPQFSVFTPIIGTEAYDIAQEKGWIIEDNWENFDSFHATMSTDKLTARETQMLHALSMLVVPQWWKPSYEKQQVAIPDVNAEMKKKYGREGEMVTEMWQTYRRSAECEGGKDDTAERGDKETKGQNPPHQSPLTNHPSPIAIILNPPSPPGVTVGKDTMGGFGQAFKGEYTEVVPPVDMAYLASQKKASGINVFVIDAIGSRLDSEHTLKLIESLEAAEVLIRTSAPTRRFDEEFAQQINEMTGVEPEFFGPVVGRNILNEDLDSLPLPAWDLFPRYNLGALSAHRRYLPIQASVGCPYNCDYCPYPVAQGTDFRPRAPEKIADEMLHFNATLGVDFFLFRDPVFTLHRKTTMALCNLLVERAGGKIQWRCETRADVLDDELLTRMAEAGCVGINFGVESLAAESLALVHRKVIDPEKIKAVVAKCKELSIEAFVFYIVGLPGETRASFNKTLKFARELETPFVQFMPITPYPNTAIDKWARETEYLIGELHDAPHYGTEPLMRNENLTAADIKELCEMAYKPGLKRPSVTVKENAVALAKCTDYAAVETALAKVLKELGGIEAVVKPHDKVLIKPNLIGSYPPEKAATTHPALVKAVIKAVINAGGIPSVGDSPGGAELPSYKDILSLQQITGMAEACEETGAELVDFSQRGAVNVAVEGKMLQELTISKAVVDADVIISLPKAKTHAFTYYTGAIKNLYGVVPGLRKAEYHKLAPSTQEFAQLLNDIHDYLRPKVKLVIMDGVVGMDGNGPTAGEARRGNFILGGTDSLHVDLATCALLGLDYNQSLPLVEAIGRRTQDGKINLTVLGDNVKDIKAPRFRAPLHQSQESFIEIYASIFPQINPDKCVQCERCVKSCPMDAIKDFMVDWDECIKCLCCFEMCPNDAVQLVKQEDAEHAVGLSENEKAGKRESEKTGKRGSELVQSMKILVISNLYPPHFVGGYELAGKEIVDRLHARGHEILVLTSMFGLAEPIVDGAQLPEGRNGEYPVIRQFDHCYGQPDNLSVIDIPLSAYNEYVLKKHAAEFHPEVIYLWNFHGLSMQSVMQAVLDTGVPYVFHAMDYHLLPQHGLPQWQEESVRRFLSRKECRIIAMSGTVRRKFVATGYQQTQLVYHGVEMLLEPGDRQNHPRKLLYTGQIREGKGVHVLLEALKRVKDVFPDISLDIFGGGDERYESQLKNISQANSLPVVFHGSLPREELLQRYAEYDVFVLPTLREEPFGIVMIEAMNAGLPVIASNAGGPTEIIVDGETGLLFKQGNADELTKAIIRLCKDDALYQTISDNGYQLVKERFDIDNSVSQIEEILNEGARGQEGKRVKGQEGKASNPLARHHSPLTTHQLPVIWHAPIFDPSGYADEARNFTLALAKHTDVNLKLNPIKWSDIETELDDDTRSTLHRLMNVSTSGKAIEIHHLFPPQYRPKPTAAYNIGRTMFETDRLPDKARRLSSYGKDWVSKCNEMDEIWVPTEFNRETFAQAGVMPEKLFKVPGTLPVEKYDTNIPPLDLEERRGFNFLSIFDWSLRKGWDVLLKAYLTEFNRDEDVALFIKTYSSLGLSAEQIHAVIIAFIQDSLKLDLADIPDLVVLDQILPVDMMPRLFKAADTYVMPSRAEGWGRPYMEAMALAIPTIGTRWSGHLEFMNEENSYLIDCDVVDVPEEGWREIPTYQGHRWAEPSEEHLRQLMREVFEQRESAKQKGLKARQDILANYNWERVAQIISGRIAEISEGVAANQSSKTRKPETFSFPQRRGFAYSSPSPFRIIWEGSQFVNSSLALVNREIVIALAKSGQCELSLRPYEGHEFGAEVDPERFGVIEELLNKPLNGAVDFHIRHLWPPNMNPPTSSFWIVMQPWEYGSMPSAWLPCFRDEVDEIWVYTHYNRDCYIQDGIPPHKVAVIPLAVDCNRFKPDLEPLPLIAGRTAKKCKFLFVGGTIWRKGIDVLLDAYTRAFSQDDDVCLVIKDMGHNSFYKGQTATARIQAIQSDDNAPEIVYLTDTLSDAEIACLYAACDCLVHPYRGEGFGLPVAEAMASGLPVILSRGGACDDFALDDGVYWIPTQKAYVDIQQDTVNKTWVLQPDADELVELMKHIAAHPKEVQEKGRKASEHIRQTLSWEKTAQAILARLEALKNRESDVVAGSVLPKREGEPVHTRANARGTGEPQTTLPESALEYNESAKRLAQEGKLADAEAQFKRAIGLEQNFVQPYNNLAVLYWQQGRTGTALAMLKQAMKIDPDDLDVTANYGLMCQELGQPQQAISLFEAYLERHPGNQEIASLLSSLD